jgi:hypothetical protein
VQILRRINSSTLRLVKSCAAGVLGVADKEGAHADDEMNENYRRILESEPVKFIDGTADLGPVNVTRFTVGSAGIELLRMLDGTFPRPAKASGPPI